MGNKEGIGGIFLTNSVTSGVCNRVSFLSRVKMSVDQLHILIRHHAMAVKDKILKGLGNQHLNLTLVNNELLRTGKNWGGRN